MQTGEVDAKQTAALKARLQPALGKIAQDAKHPLYVETLLLCVGWQDAAANSAARKLFANPEQPRALRTQCLELLITANDAEVLPLVAQVLSEKQNSSANFRGQILAALGRSTQPAVAEWVINHYAQFEPELQPKAIELLTQYPAWSKQLVSTIRAGKLPATVLNASQLVKMQASNDAELKQQILAVWGTVRLERNPQREQVVSEMKKMLQGKLGDPQRGALVFQKVCGQCHKIHGQGQDVGPDITANGRASFEQLLSNVFDPSLVIGASYQARNVILENGRQLSGLLVEENEQRIVLKMQGGKIETIPRDQVEELHISPLSLMPEGLEKQLKPEEISDLFGFLVLDKPPSDPAAKTIPGTP